MSSLLFWLVWVFLYRVANAAVEAGKDLRQHDNAAYYYWVLAVNYEYDRVAFAEEFGTLDDFRNPEFLVPKRGVQKLTRLRDALGLAHRAAEQSRFEYQHINGPVGNAYMPYNGMACAAALLSAETRVAISKRDAEGAVRGIRAIMSLSRHVISDEKIGLGVDGLLSIIFVEMALNEIDCMVSHKILTIKQYDSLCAMLVDLEESEDPFRSVATLRHSREVWEPAALEMMMESVQRQLQLAEGGGLPPDALDLKETVETNHQRLEEVLDTWQQDINVFADNWNAPNADEFIREFVVREERGDYAPLGAEFGRKWLRTWYTEQRVLNRVADLRLHLETEAAR